MDLRQVSAEATYVEAIQKYRFESILSIIKYLNYSLGAEKVLEWYFNIMVDTLRTQTDTFESPQHMLLLHLLAVNNFERCSFGVTLQRSKNSPFWSEFRISFVKIRAAELDTNKECFLL